MAPAWVLLAKARGLYGADHVRIRHQTIDELRGLFDWVTISVAATRADPDGAGHEGLHGQGRVDHVARGAGSRIRAACRRPGTLAPAVPAERSLLVGDGPLAEAMARKLALEHGHHLELVERVGIVADDGNPGGAQTAIELDALPRAAFADEDVERVIVAVHDLDEGRLSQITATCRSMGIKLSVAPAAAGHAGHRRGR